MSDLEHLRRAHRALATDAGGDACPPPERLYDAASGALPPEAIARLVDHVGACGACASEWALVRAALAPAEALPGVEDAHRNAEPAVVPLRPARARLPWRRVGVAMGALAAAAALGLWVRPPAPAPPSAPVYRARDLPAPAARIPDGAALPRAAFTLAWEPGPAGARYALTVGDEAGRPLHRVAGIDTPSATVPPEALAGQPDGAIVVWQVEETREDGTTHRSVAYRVVVR